MTVQEALEVKSITDKCVGNIPAQYVDRIWHYYILYVDPTRNRQSRPCTCSPRYWTEILFRLKDKVTDTLREYNETPGDIGEF